MFNDIILQFIIMDNIIRETGDVFSILLNIVKKKGCAKFNHFGCSLSLFN